jgi:selenocysteine-specific elongation factor
MDNKESPGGFGRMSHVTIGIAGHIDHGKTSLTKALTNIETDRLKEEQERNISIENGFAFLDTEGGERLAVIDVPGHEGFIRQMIAGVAGIDLVLLCVAADEGVMPQTLEHVHILDLLHIENAFIVVTKSDLVEEDWLDMVEEEIREGLKGTRYYHAPLIHVDSLSGRGIEELKTLLFEKGAEMKGKSLTGPLRLPIDDVFTLHGHGTVIRGTIFNGSVQKEKVYRLLPLDEPVRIKQMQVHHELVDRAQAGQRLALNIAGVPHHAIQRGQVLVSGKAFKTSTRIDIQCQILDAIRHPIKQRTQVVVHHGTTVAQGRLIFFDRNEVKSGGEFFCQLELDEPLVVTKGDRLILRRPSPVETIGGGMVLDPSAQKHRFGQKTIDRLELLSLGTPEEWVLKALEDTPVLTQQDLIGVSGLSVDEAQTLITQLIDEKKIKRVSDKQVASTVTLDGMKDVLLAQLAAFHEENPLKVGMNKAAWRILEGIPVILIDFVTEELQKENQLEMTGPHVRLTTFQPSFPSKWKKRMEAVVTQLEKEGLQTSPFRDLLKNQQIPESLGADFFHFLTESGTGIKVEDDRLIHQAVFHDYLGRLKEAYPGGFSVQGAKEILEGSRKHVLPYLETLDKMNITARDGSNRVWVSKK